MMTRETQVQAIPDYLRPYIAKQDASLYTPMDHASWRYILKISNAFFAKHAHQKYLDGLSETGISVDRIPLIEEMDQCLRQFGWQAVAVSGFIPPAVFMEFLSLGVLPIACDMRKIENIAYTPAPDIVHEAAGHAPIVADPEYAAYLRSYGEVSRKAIFSDQDMNVYHAIRALSEIKEDPASTKEEIEAAQKSLDEAVSAVTFDSEATFLSRMGWWTFEYGLVGDLAAPKIYGAGLLSSVGESYHVFDKTVKKIPFSIDCVEMSYDITRPQPQLYVAPDFHRLKEGLVELANRMAFKKGGAEGLEKAKQAATITTTQLDTGVQISGTLKNFLKDESGKVFYLQYQGPTQLSYENREISGQGANYHKEGFGTPLERITEADLKNAGFSKGKKSTLRLKSGVTIEGVLENQLTQKGEIILLTFDQCTVKKGSEYLFRPEWGKYDIVCGERIVSVFGGAADRKRYLEVTGGFHQEPGRQKSNLTEENRELNELYAQVRKLRDLNQWDEQRIGQLEGIYRQLEKKYPLDWLLRYEILEIAHAQKLNLKWAQGIRSQLEKLAQELPGLGETIQRGLELVKEAATH
jgi:phenylalanine-4-hydroxylase